MKRRMFRSTLAALISMAAKKGVVAPPSVIATHFDAAEQALHAI